MYVIDSPYLKMTFCPTYGLAIKVVESLSINKSCIKEYWSDTWLFTHYGFRVPSPNEDLISIAFGSQGKLALLSQDKLWKIDWFLKVEKPLLSLLKHEIKTALIEGKNKDFYKIECKDSDLYVSKNDMKLIINTLNLFDINKDRKEIFI